MEDFSKWREWNEIASSRSVLKKKKKGRKGKEYFQRLSNVLGYNRGRNIYASVVIIHRVARQNISAIA